MKTLLLLPVAALFLVQVEGGAREWRSNLQCFYRNTAWYTESHGHRFLLILTDSLHRPLARYEGLVEMQADGQASLINLPAGYDQLQAVVSPGDRFNIGKIEAEKRTPVPPGQPDQPLYPVLLTLLSSCLFLLYGWWSVKEGTRRFREPGDTHESTDAPPCPDEHAEFYKALRQVVEAHAGDPDLTALRISKLLCLGYATCLRRVKAATGMTISEYLKHVRIQRATALLREHLDQTIATIAYDSGFTSNTHFSREFKKVMGCTPTDYRRKGKN